MGMYKNFLIGVTELVWSAMEKGFTDEDGIYAYVYMYEPRVSRETVSHILKSISEQE